MGNAFMPSVMTSLNQAGGMTLQSILEQRALQQELAQQQAKLDQSSMGDMLSFGMRMRADQRAEAGNVESRRRWNAEQAVRERTSADKQWEAESRENALISAANMPASASLQDRRILAQEAGAPMTAFDLPEAKETPAERSARIRQDVIDRETAQEPFVRAREGRAAARDAAKTKPASDEQKAPPDLLDEIEGYRDRKLTGWSTHEEAKKSIEFNWPRLRAKYGKLLDRAAVIKALPNIYGTRVKDSTGDDGDDIIVLGSR
jgi:hypothetical protein